jgi:hypothetical protein
MSEDELLSAIVELAKLRGWRVYHARPARTSRGYRTLTQGDVGWPDLTLVRQRWDPQRECLRTRCLIWELKAERGVLSAGQREWVGLLQDVAGLEVALVRPDDWISGDVERWLA